MYTTKPNRLVAIFLVLAISIFALSFLLNVWSEKQPAKQDITYWINGKQLTINNLTNYHKGENIDNMSLYPDMCGFRIDTADNWIIAYQMCDNAAHDFLYTFDEQGNVKDF